MNPQTASLKQRRALRAPGATHDHLMTHISITTGTATWGAHVTDEEYPGVT